MNALAAPAADAVMPGVLGFLVVAGLGLVLFFLLRSLNKQLQKVAGPAPPWRDSRSPDGAGAGTPDDGPGGAGPGGAGPGGAGPGGARAKPSGGRPAT